MIVAAFAAGLVTGIVFTITALIALRRELALYRRAQGRTMTFEHRSRP